MKLPFELQNDESVILFCRRHWLYFTLKLVGVALLWLLPTIAVLWLTNLTAGLGGTVGKVVWAAAALWTLYCLVWAYFTWYRYQNDIWVVTNQRIVDSTKYHWFKRRLASADLIDVQDMNVVREGIFPTIFNFGDVRCQTAAELPNFVVAGVPNPDKVLATVDAARDASRRALMRPLP